MLARAQRCADGRLRFTFFREAVERLLGEDELISDGDFEDPAATRDELDPIQEMAVICGEGFLRQTGGSSDVASRGAVFDPHLSG